MNKRVLTFLLMMLAVGCTPKVEDEGRYAICTNYTTLEVENFAKLVKNGILRGNWNSLADKIAFPVMVNGTPVEKDGFVDTFRDTLATRDFVEGIKQETCRSIFCNYQGIMMANGSVWISEILDQNGNSCSLKVISFNSLD